MADNNPNAILQSILPLTSQVNSVTGLHDDQIAVLRGLLNKNDKVQAQNFINQVGTDKARQLADAHDATSQSNQDGSHQEGNQSQSSKILDPLIEMARQGQTQVPSSTINNPAPAANVKTGQFELDKPNNWFEENLGNAQAPYQDASGNIHVKLGGRFNQDNDLSTLQKAGAIQTLTGKQNVAPTDSIAYKVEQAMQEAQKTPMTQAQKAEYNLNVQGKAAELSKGIADQTMNAITPLTTNLQKIDSLMPLFDNALSSDQVTAKTAVSQLAPLLRDLSGDKTNGNILNQGLIEKMFTGVSGRVGADLITKSRNNVVALRKALINRVGTIQNNSASKIGSFKIGDQVVNGNQLLNHAYFNEAGRAVNVFKTEQEAKKAGLVDGTPITVNGKTAFWKE